MMKMSWLPFFPKFQQAFALNPSRAYRWTDKLTVDHRMNNPGLKP